jgi:hypothetical protein
MPRKGGVAAAAVGTRATSSPSTRKSGSTASGGPRLGVLGASAQAAPRGATVTRRELPFTGLFLPFLLGLALALLAAGTLMARLATQAERRAL